MLYEIIFVDVSKFFRMIYKPQTNITAFDSEWHDPAIESLTITTISAPGGSERRLASSFDIFPDYIISEYSVIKNIKRLKSGTAPGIDGITPDHL